MKKQKHTSNPVTFILGTAFMLAYVLYSGSQTWLLVDWLFPGDALVMKVLTVVTFDVSALFFFILHQFHRPATEGSKTIVLYGSIIDFILSIVATGFYLTLRYVTHYNGMVDPNLVTAMYVTVLVAMIINIIFVACWWSIEWGAYHPNDPVFKDDDEPALPTIIREIKSAPTVALARVEPAPQIEESQTVEIEPVSTNKPDSSTNKNNTNKPEVSTNKKKLPRRNLLGIKQ